MRAISTIKWYFHTCEISLKYCWFELAEDTSTQKSLDIQYLKTVLSYKTHRKALQVLKALHVSETDLNLSRHTNWFYFSFLHHPNSIALKRSTYAPTVHPAGCASYLVSPPSSPRGCGWLLCFYCCLAPATTQKKGPRKNTVHELSSDTTNTQAKNLQTQALSPTMPSRSLWRRTTLCHHSLEDAHKTHGQPCNTPPQQSHRSALCDNNHFKWNHRSPTPQRILLPFPSARYHLIKFGGSDGHESHESGTACYAGRAHLNCFFVMRKKFKSAQFK
jgi:hypothetical protein